MCVYVCMCPVLTYIGHIRAIEKGEQLVFKDTIKLIRTLQGRLTGFEAQ